MIDLMQIDHVGIAVEDLDAEVDRYRRLLGAEPAHRERVESQGAEEVLFGVGTSFVQLVASLGPDTPVGRFLARRGPGVHHVGYRVEDIAGTLERLRAKGSG
jgi:methylmalonyl-CoA/ethylmalonyl-CoA epimerase